MRQPGSYTLADALRQRRGKMSHKKKRRHFRWTRELLLKNCVVWPFITPSKLIAESVLFQLKDDMIATSALHVHLLGCSWTGSPGWRSAPTRYTRWGLLAACLCSEGSGPTDCCWGETRWSLTEQQQHWPQPWGQRWGYYIHLDFINTLSVHQHREVCFLLKKQ